MLACAKIQRDQLGDYSSATQTYQDFLKRFPRSSRKREAQEGVAELALLQNGAKPAAPAPTSGRAMPKSTVAQAALPDDEGSGDLPPSTTLSATPASATEFPEFAAFARLRLKIPLASPLIWKGWCRIPLAASASRSASFLIYAMRGCQWK